MKTLKELSNNAYYDMGSHSQIVIDFVQETEILFDIDEPKNNKEKYVLLQGLGAHAYDISVTLEVFNPELTDEISILKNLESLIDIRMAYINSLDFKK